MDGGVGHVSIQGQRAIRFCAAVLVPASVLGCLLGSGSSRPAAAAGNTLPGDSSYVWPLEAPPLLTSSFGEFRETHLHAGIDLGTGGRIGLRCFAVADGWVARLRMSPFGYGKAVYLQLDTGQLVVYAHLSRFAPALAERARREQLQRQSYTFDVYLEKDAIRVRRGEVIAWSGDTGVGFPHLHFEVRDGDVARNPQTAGFVVRDRIAPSIRDVAIMPLDARSQVDGEPETRLLGKVQSGMPPVRVSGRIGFAVRAADRAAADAYRQAPYRQEVRVDGELLYRATHERFDYAHNHHIVLEYDQDRLQYKNQRAFLLFGRAGNALPAREPTDGGRGVLYAGVTPPLRPGPHFQLEPGLHDVVIEVADVAGHTKSVHFPLQVATPPAIEALVVHRNARGWDIVCEAEDTDGDSLKLALAVTGDQGNTWEEIRPAPAVRDGNTTRWLAQWLPQASTSPATPEAEASRDVLVRATVRDPSDLVAIRTATDTADHKETNAVQAAASPPMPELELTARWGAGRFVVELQSPVLLAGQPSLYLTQGTARRLQPDLLQIEERRWRWVRDLESLGDRVDSIDVDATSLARQRLHLRRAVDARIVQTGTARHIDDLAPGWTLQIDADTFFEPVAIRARSFEGAKLPLGPELMPTGACVDLESRAAAVNGRIAIRYRQPQADEVATNGHGKPEPIGLFYVDRGGSLKFLSAERDASGAWSGKLPYLSIVALLRDDTPPVLGDFAYQRGRLSCRATDGGADLADGAIRAEIDGSFAIPEWDPETGNVLVHPAGELAAGTHTLHVAVVDRLGNHAARDFAFTVTKGP